MGRRVRYTRRFLFSVYLLLQSFWSLRCCWIYTRHWSILPPSLSTRPGSLYYIRTDLCCLRCCPLPTGRARLISVPTSQMPHHRLAKLELRFRAAVAAVCCRHRFLHFSFAAPLFIRKSEDLFFTVATKSDSHALTRFLPPLPFLFDQHSTTMDLSRRPLKSCLSFLLENETFYFFFVFLFSFNTQINRCFVFAWPHYTRWEKRRRSSPQQLRRRAKRGRAGGVSTKEPLNRGLFSGASLAFKLEDVWR